MIDLHSHILPGIDDGAKTLADSVEIVKELASQGVTDIIATPHFIDETLFMSPRKKNLTLLKKLQKSLKDEGVEVKVYLGNELYINEKMIDLIKSGEVSTMANSKYVLVELPMRSEFPNYKDFLKELLEHNYKVLVAHPERYSIVQKDYDIVNELDEIGVLFQCNLGSLTGRYGSEAKKVLKKMLKEGKVFGFGSDTHRAGRTDAITQAIQKLKKYCDDEKIEKLLITNPSSLLYC